MPIGEHVATAISIVAILISLASLGFGIHQNRVLQRSRKDEKANSVIRIALDIRRKLQDLKHKIDTTDDIEDCAEFIEKSSAFLEERIPVLMGKRLTSLEDLFEAEKRLLSLELEIDLLAKQVGAADELNKEVREYKSDR